MGPLVYTVGTTWHEAPANRDWAYLLWLGSDASLVSDRTFAIYAKPGGATNPAPYQRVAITAVQTDTHVINPLLQRATSIGEDLVKLEVDIDALFGKFIPASLTRAEKISAVIRGALGDAGHYGKVMLLARTHPSVAMSLGVAMAEPIGAGLTTFEIREFNPATQKDVAVIGRVTVQAGAPTVLPAPGTPVQVPRNGARGDLNAPLRWGTPDDLRRLSLLQHGYNVWRVRKDYAVANNWHITPPAASAINAAYSSTTAVRRVNSLPLITSKIFTLAEAANFVPPTADTNTVFAIDTDDRGKPGYIPTDFTNGAHFIYFVSARDILGRDGLLSPGLDVLLCDQLPPNALDKVEVVNDYVFTGGTPQHFLRINWRQADNTTNKEEQIVSYWVYRWTNISELHSNLNNAVFNLIQVVPHIANAAKNTYLDNGPTAPTEATAINRTYFYTVRCLDNGACGGNLSPHSAPVAGALRDRVGPAGPTGSIRTTCLDPLVVQGIIRTNLNVSPLRTFTIGLHDIRATTFVRWMESYAEIISGTNIVASFPHGLFYFPPGVNTNDWSFQIPVSYNQLTLMVHARCGLADGQVSSWKVYPQSLSVLNDSQNLDGLEINSVSLAVASKDPRDCGKHYPTTPGLNDINPINIIVVPTPTTREMKLYRRIDDGPLQFICQKTNPPTDLSQYVCQDDAFPPQAVEICYYAQLYDEHGNPSPMVRLGCTNVASTIELPRPMLAPLNPSPSVSVTQTLARWFCPPGGLDRFEVGIAAKPGLSTNPAAGLLVPTGAIETHFVPPNVSLKKLKFPALGQNLDFTIYRTPHIGNGSTFGDGAQFSLAFDSVHGGNYVVFVRAVGKDGTIGPRSNYGRLTWANPSNAPLPTVAWPARALPNVSNSFTTNFTATWLAGGVSGYTGAVVNIGYVFGSNNFGFADYAARPQVLNNVKEPTDYLFQDASGGALFPVVMYRYQVPSAKFPTVSGDVVQVSPLMENIAYERTNFVGSIIHDPFVIYEGAYYNFGNGSLSVLATYFKDTQPVVSGSRYRYLLVRLQSDGEIAEVIPTTDVDIP